MFFKLVSRNSRRNRKENGLFFSSLLVSVIAFYIILSLPRQDIMLFLAKMESDAVDRLLTLIPAFYGITLFILFFLIYYASKYQLERRRHEFGVYLMLGMRRTRLFAMLLAEDCRSSILSLVTGLPAAILLSELISLATAKLVGLGIIGHQSSFSWESILWTAAGFILIKLVTFLILSARISRQEIGSLLTDIPDGTKKQHAAFIYAASAITGAICLAAAYILAACGRAWMNLRYMGLTMILGLSGTFLFFWGLQFLLRLIATSGKKDRQLHIFNFRQIQETVIHRHSTLAVCSLLILAALCCFGSGLAIFRFYRESEKHILDYTFTDNAEQSRTVQEIRQTLQDNGLTAHFSDLFEMRVGSVRTTDDIENVFETEPLMSALNEMPASEDRDVLLNNLSYASYPYLILLDDYNQLLAAAGKQPLTLQANEAAVYMDNEFSNPERTRLLNDILKDRPETMLDQETIRLTGPLQTDSLVTDRSITLSFALIVPEETFQHFTEGEYESYLNGILAENETENTSLLSAISAMNAKLDKTGLTYESYLQNMGRQLFYMTAASYITIYLAIIFLLIANTAIGIQFLISQRKSSRRYRTLIHLGATYAALRQSARKQINWYFGIPVSIAALGSLFGVRSLLTGILSSRSQGSLSEMLPVSAAMILGLCVVEYIYIMAVKRSSDRYLLTLMTPEREE